MKLYGIAYRRETPRPELIEAARQTARERLPRPATTESRYGAGFLGIHDGRGANFVFIDWWQEENELVHHVFVSPADKPEMLEYKTPTGLIACVWDLRVLGFERQAWLDEVLTNPDGPDIEGYLARRLNEDV